MNRRPTPFWTKFNWIVLPQLILTIFLLVYLSVGAVIFQQLDPHLANYSFGQIIAFEVSTLATIGFGDVAPRSTYARAFCIVFSIFGIPLFLLAVANIGKYVTKATYILFSKLSGKRSLGAMRGDSRMPLFVSLLLFFLLVFIGTLVINHSGEDTFHDNLYFSFIAFSTIGFGDLVPLTSSTHLLLFNTVYLIIGVVVVSAVFTSFHEYLRKTHYLGRRFRGGRDVQVWMGGRSMPVSSLLTIVGQEFDASPREIREVLRDLDCLILSVIDKREEDNEEKIHKGQVNRFYSRMDSPPIVHDLEDFDDI